MHEYVRPVVDAPPIRDAAGEVIPFGARWPGSPPEEAYSVDAYPERFAPLHAVADALLAHLEATFDVEVVEGVEVASDLTFPPLDVARAVRIVPRDPACASLTLVWTSYPGVRLHAGVLHDGAFPPCGCEACDESGEREVERLEDEVLAVVTGRFRERLVGSPEEVETAFDFGDHGAMSYRTWAATADPERVRAALPRLRGVAGGWRPWPGRAEGS